MKQIHWSGILSAALIIFVAASCGTNNSKSGKGIIDVESAVGKGSVVNLSEIASDIKYVRLETNAESVIGNVWNVKLSKGKIYVSDNKYTISIFSEDGKFIKKFSRVGRGPEEYVDISTFQVNDTDGGIEIMDRSGRIIRYDSDGNFIEVIDKVYQKARSQSFVKISDFIVSGWYQTSRLEGQMEFKYGVTAYVDSLNILSEKITTSLSSMKMQQVNGGMAVYMRIDPPYLIKHKDEVKFMMAECDTIFGIDSKGQISDKYVLGYGKYHSPKDMDYDTHTNNESNFVSLSTAFSETDRFLLLIFNLRAMAPEPIERTSKGLDGKENITKNTNVYAIFDKKKGNLTFLNQPEKGTMGFKEDIKGGFPFWPRFTGNNGELINFRNAIDIIIEAEKNPENKFAVELASKLTENDNPVIIIVTPK
ncbi:MAG: 6-bladed beta-propeller [Bacteroidales bacterium]|nr:6-bladed beta-propeller [Bacteroidales bacterium]